MVKSKNRLLRNTSQNSTCSITTKLIEYSVSDVKYCQQHKKNANETTDDTIFGALKRWFTCTSNDQLRAQNDIEDKMLMTVVECETHPNARCKTVKNQRKQ